MASNKKGGKASKDGEGGGGNLGFTDFLGTSLKEIPEGGSNDCPIGKWRLKWKGSKVDLAKGRVMVIMQPIEAIDVGKDVLKNIAKMDVANEMRPVFENFNCNPGEIGQRMLKQRLMAAGVDATLPTTQALKAATNTEWVGDVIHSPNDNDPNRPYINLRNVTRA